MILLPLVGGGKIEALARRGEYFYVFVSFHLFLLLFDITYREASCSLSHLTLNPSFPKPLRLGVALVAELPWVVTLPAQALFCT
jgi:hypothetical protein